MALRREMARLGYVSRPSSSTRPLAEVALDPLGAAGIDADPWQRSVLASDAKQMLLLCSRQAGKSLTAAAKSIQTAIREPGALVLLLSPTLRQSGELFRDKVVKLYDLLGRPVPVRQESALQLTLVNGSRIVSLPGDEETIRGYSGVALLIIDEASRVPDDLYKSVRPMLAVSGGKLIALTTPFGKRGWFYREWEGNGPWHKVKITAEQCPRITQEFLAEERRQLGPDWYDQEYMCLFASAGGSPMFPSEWLKRSQEIAERLRGKYRRGRAMGVDPAEGGDSSVWCVVDEFGVVFMQSLKTPDTSIIPARTVELMNGYSIPAERVYFDRGGGGKEHADRLRAMGHEVVTVAFGESVQADLRVGATLIEERQDIRESRYTYVNRRAQMYGVLRQLLDPSGAPNVVPGGRRGDSVTHGAVWGSVKQVTGCDLKQVEGFAIPGEYAEVLRQLAPIPLTYDGEGRLYLLPKSKKDPNSTTKTLTDLLGCSPDEGDSLALACHALAHEVFRPYAGALWGAP